MHEQPNGDGALHDAAHRDAAHDANAPQNHGASGHGNVHHGDVNGTLVQIGHVHGDVRPAPPPHEVPRLFSRFENREAERAALQAALTPSAQRAEAPSVRISTVYGPPGCGKSALARRWAHEASDRFPGGQLFVDYAELQAYEATGGAVAEALRQCVRALGVQNRALPGSLPELAKLFRSRTSAAPILVVLDSVTEPAQVRPLVPGAEGSAVLVAGRRLGELAQTADVHDVRLRPLDDEHSLALLVHFSGDAEVARREPAAAAQVVAACAGQPLALRIAGNKYRRHRRRRGLAALAVELVDERRRLAALTVRSVHGEHALSAAFTLAYEELTAEEARLYRLLGLYPGTSADLGIVVCLSGADPDTALDLLYALEDAGLMEESEQDGRFRFHELVGLHAKERGDEEEGAAEREAVLERAVDYYVTGAAFADLTVLGEDRLRIGGDAAHRPGAQNPFAGENARHAALAWLRSERADALAVLQAAAEHGGGMQRQVWQLAESLTALYLHTRHLGDWLVAGRLGATAAAADGDVEAEARLRALLSRPLCDTDELAEARTELDAALRCAEGTDHLQLRASVHEFDGRYWDLVDPQRAIPAYERALALSQEAEDERGAALALYFLGGTLTTLGELPRATEVLTEAEERLRALDDIRMAARALAALGRVREATGEADAAYAAYGRAAEELRATEAHHYEAEVLRALARHADRTGAHAAAHDHRTRALALYEEAGSPLAEEVRAELAPEA